MPKNCGIFFPLATLAEVHLKIFPARCARGGNGLFFAKSRKTEKNPENPTQREKKKANLTPDLFGEKKKKDFENLFFFFQRFLKISRFFMKFHGFFQDFSGFFQDFSRIFKYFLFFFFSQKSFFFFFFREKRIFFLEKKKKKKDLSRPVKRQKTKQNKKRRITGQYSSFLDPIFVYFFFTSFLTKKKPLCEKKIVCKKRLTFSPVLLCTISIVCYFYLFLFYFFVKKNLGRLCLPFLRYMMHFVLQALCLPPPSSLSRVSFAALETFYFPYKIIVPNDPNQEPNSHNTRLGAKMKRRGKKKKKRHLPLFCQLL